MPVFASAPVPVAAVVAVDPVAAELPELPVLVATVVEEPPPPVEPAGAVVELEGTVVDDPDEPMVVVAMGWNLYAGWVVQTAGVARQPDTVTAG